MRNPNEALNPRTRRWLAAALLAGAALATPAVHADTPEAEAPAAALEPVMVTAPRMLDAGRIETDPRRPRLPLPPQDGGAYLKSIPGFTNSRKGGTSGDPELRGQGGSRLNLLLDGAPVLGAGGGRMDPPTAYVYPESYERIEVLKGPQSVRHGAATAGVVRFERDTPYFPEPDVEGRASFTAGSHSRMDHMGEVTAGDRLGYVRMLGTLSTQDDYRDGDGERVHSAYERWAGSAAVGWTPDPDSVVEFTYERSDGEAAFDDRPLDGTAFDRTGYKLRAEREHLTPWLTGVEAQLFHDDNEHEMDNFRLRDAPEPGTMPFDEPTIQFPDRRSVGGRLAAELLPAESLALTVGADYVQHEHASPRNPGNTGMAGSPVVQGDDALQFRRLDREDDVDIEHYGVFAELEHTLTVRDRLDYGLRVDRNKAEARREPWGMFAGFGDAAPGTTQRETLTSGFLRYTHELDALPAQLHAGVGRAERAPDFWERGGPAQRRGGFEVDPERLTQLDVGAGYAGRRWEANAALFYGEFDDYLLIDYTPMGMESEVINVDATHYGLEGDLTRHLDPVWSTTATLAWVRADNDSADEPLAQTPPPEATLSLDYDDGRAFAGVLGRAVARQHRIHEGFGTIYSEDQQKTPGFATLALYGGYRFTEHVDATLGVDNLFDRAYAEHIQRRGGGFQTPGDELLNEPGRNLWGRITATF